MLETAIAAVRQFALFAALLTPLEILWPARARAFWRRGLGTDLAYFFVGPFAISVGATVLLALLAAVVERVIPSGVHAAAARQPWGVQLTEVLILSELGGYWVHRASHRVRWLWRFHAVHHSAESLDWIAAHRQHPVEAVWLLGVANLPALALGFDTEALVAFVLAQKLYTAFLHANVRVGFGRLTAWLASPQFHHWHHDGATADAGNYASFLPCLDRLFGTYRLPPGFPARYGCDEPVGDGVLRQLVHPLS